VHVRTQRDVVPACVQALTNLAHRFGILHADNSEANEVKALIGAGDDLLD